MLVPKSVSMNVGRFAARESARYVINGVLLKRNGSARVRGCGDPYGVAVATDGKRLIRATWPEIDHRDYPPVGDLESVDGFSAIVPTAELTAAGKGIKRTPKPILGNLLVEEGRAKPNGSPGVVGLVSTPDGASINRSESLIEEGSFPDYESVIPKAGDSCTTVYVNPKLLGESLVTMAKMGAAMVRIEVPNTRKGAIRIDSVPGDNASNLEAELTAVVMPMGKPE